MTQLYVKAWFLWVVVVILILVGGVSAFSYVNTINYQNEATNLKTFLISERTNHNETKQCLDNSRQNLNNVIYTLNQTTLNLTQKTTELIHTYNRISMLSIENNNVTFSLKETKQQWNETKEELTMFYNELDNITEELSLLRNETLYNPTYNEVISFLGEDTTDDNIYKNWYEAGLNYTEYYVCVHFSKDLVHSAFLKRMNCYIVTMLLFDGYDFYGHVIVCFNTTDSGIIFVEPQNDLTFFNLEEWNLYYGLGNEYFIYDLTIIW